MYIEKIVSHGSHNEKELLKLISSQINDISSELIGDLSHINHRAECHTGAEPKRVEHVSSNEYVLHFQFQWSVYNGCSDMDLLETEFESTHFIVKPDGELVFDFPIRNERSTHDEL